jgi:hypothetical protein
MNNPTSIHNNTHNTTQAKSAFKLTTSKLTKAMSQESVSTCCNSTKKKSVRKSKFRISKFGSNGRRIPIELSCSSNKRSSIASSNKVKRRVDPHSARRTSATQSKKFKLKTMFQSPNNKPQPV